MSAPQRERSPHRLHPVEAPENSNSLRVSTTKLSPAPSVTAHLEQIVLRIIQGAIDEAKPQHWLRRADTFAAVGNARCDADALACRRHARILAEAPPGTEAADYFNRGVVS